jgi:anti-anti-sigma factor
VNVNVRHVEGACIVNVEGSVDISNAHELKDAVFAAIQEKASCILNLRKATHVDSSGLGTLISLNAALAQSGVAFRIAGVPRSIMQILELTQTISILPADSTVLESLNVLGLTPGSASPSRIAEPSP